MTPSPTPEPDAGRVPPRWRRAGLLALLALLVVTAAVLTRDVVARRDQDPEEDRTATSLTRVQQSCRDWMVASPAAHEPSNGWCTDMFTWMGEQEDGPMMRSMMWRGHVQLAESCRRWVDRGDAEPGPSSSRRCEEMAGWMDEHLTSRHGAWMMRER